MDMQLYLVGLWTELPQNYTLKSIIYKEYTVVEIPSTFVTDSTQPMVFMWCALWRQARMQLQGREAACL